MKVEASAQNKSKIQIKQAPDMRMAHFQYLHYALSIRSATVTISHLVWIKTKKQWREMHSQFTNETNEVAYMHY